MVFILFLAVGGLGRMVPFLSIPTVQAEGPQVLLTPTILTSLRQEAAANSARWVAFKASLDANLGLVISSPYNEGEYQGSHLLWVSNYALGYQILKDSNPTTAAKYADKAIGIMNAALTGYLKSGQETRQFLARGDGNTKTFTLANSDNISDLHVYVSTISTVPIVHNSLHGDDDTSQYYEAFIKVSNTNDGPANYILGTDWQHSSNWNSYINWSLGGSEPAQGATYYLTMAPLGGTPTSVSRNGAQITFTTAPTANQAILVEYTYGTHAGDCSTLAYQETSANDGGFDSIKIDTSYTSRYLGKHLAMGFDWLYDYGCFTTAEKNQVSNMLVLWSDYVRDNGYYKTSIESNYGNGGYDSRLLTAIALQNRSAQAARLKTEMDTFRTSYLLPSFSAPGGGVATLQGGHWGEGWNYGPLSIRNILTAATAYETAGWGTATAERSWANDMVKSFVMDQSTQNTIYAGGDVYSYPEPVPNKILLSTIASMASDSTYKAYANWIVQNYAGSVSPDEEWEDLLFRDPVATATNWTDSLALQYLAPGSGFAAMRKDWNYNSTWLGFQSGNLLAADHQDPQGIMAISRGADNLLPVPFAPGGPVYPKAQYSNMILIDDGGAGEQQYRFEQGYWYDNPGVTMTHFDGAVDYAYAQGNYAAAYRKGSGTNSATELVRSIFYARNPDYIFVYDRASTTHDTYLKQLQWQFLNAPAINGNSWLETVGSSKLFGATFSSLPITTTQQPVTVGSATLQQVAVNNSSPTSSIRYVTAMQVTSSSASAMDTASRIMSVASKLEGVQMGSYVVMFGRNGTISGGDSYNITAPNGATITHYITDLPSGSYSLTGANQASAVTTSEGVLTFTTTGTGSAQTVTVGTVATDNTAPTVPTGLSATVISSSQINLTWSASTDAVGVVGYKIWRGGTQVGTSVSLSYLDNNLSALTAYTYTVSAYDAVPNESAQSTSASATTQDAPSGGGGGVGGGGYIAPNVTIINLTATPYDKQIILSWTKPADSSFVDGVIVRKLGSSPTSSTDGTTIYQGTGSSFTDTNLINGLTYYYAAFSMTVSGLSSTAKATISATPVAGTGQSQTTVSLGSTTSASSNTCSAGAGQTSGSTKQLTPLTSTVSPYTKGVNVSSLQNFLIQKNYLVSGNNTGYFGAMTVSALQKYQCDKKIICSGSSVSTGWGNVGKTTLSSINSDIQTLNQSGGGTSSSIGSLLGSCSIFQMSVAQLQTLIQQLTLMVLQLQAQLLQVKR